MIWTTSLIPMSISRILLIQMMLVLSVLILLLLKLWNNKCNITLWFGMEKSKLFSQSKDSSEEQE